MLTSFEEELAKNGCIAFTNVGVSMKPLLREGRDVMRIRAADGKSVKRYDAVLFCRPGITGRGRYVLHRVLKRLPDGNLWIVGDNCTEGETVPPENVLGVLEAVLRKGKTISVTAFSYRVYVFFWGVLYPVRIFALKVLRTLRGLWKV
ncbi:MAG: S24/S26 family peptidase [Clostridia bacterium]|nr:S24/S26 family peptidase [Clostridia bacterium]